MSRLDVIAQSLLARVFPATLLTLVFDIDMNIINMTCGKKPV